MMKLKLGCKKKRYKQKKIYKQTKYITFIFTFFYNYFLVAIFYFIVASF